MACLFVRLKCFLFGAAICAVTTSAASAQTVIFSDNFDSYADQAAFNAIWPVNGTATTMLSTTQSVSPTQSVQGLTTATRVATSFTATTPSATNVVRFSVDFYDSNGTAAAYRQYAELDSTLTPSGNGQLLALGLNNNIASNSYMARVLGVDGGSGTVGAFFKLDGVGAPTRSTGWHNLAVEIGVNKLDFYVDGVLAKSLTPTSAAFPIRAYDTVKLGSNLSAGQAAYYDNVVVSVVPEPTGILACGAVAFGLGSLLRRRR